MAQDISLNKYQRMMAMPRGQEALPGIVQLNMQDQAKKDKDMMLYKYLLATGMLRSSTADDALGLPAKDRDEALRGRFGMGQDPTKGWSVAQEGMNTFLNFAPNVAQQIPNIEKKEDNIVQQVPILEKREEYEPIYEERPIYEEEDVYEDVKLPTLQGLVNFDLGQYKKKTVGEDWYNQLSEEGIKEMSRFMELMRDENVRNSLRGKIMLESGTDATPFSPERKAEFDKLINEDDELRKFLMSQGINVYNMKDKDYQSALGFMRSKRMRDYLVELGKQMGIDLEDIFDDKIYQHRYGTRMDYEPERFSKISYKGGVIKKKVGTRKVEKGKERYEVGRKVKRYVGDKLIDEKEEKYNEAKKVGG